ncbi:RHS repeat-associated core domain-containing protein [Pseudomonas lini]
MTAHSSLEVSYKTVRYSGKEMDVSGLYYYGARYYAPWLQRWVSADPAGDVDGLNLYGFVGNNPLSYVDPDGSQKEKREIVDYSKFITVLGGYAATTLDQMLNVAHQQNIGKELLKKTWWENPSMPGSASSAAITAARTSTFSCPMTCMWPTSPCRANPCIRKVWLAGTSAAIWREGQSLPSLRPQA